jgi:hypothetical protein
VDQGEVRLWGQGEREKMLREGRGEAWASLQEDQEVVDPSSLMCLCLEEEVYWHSLEERQVGREDQVEQEEGRPHHQRKIEPPSHSKDHQRPSSGE